MGLTWHHRLVKRLLDIVVSSLVLVALAPLLALIVLAIWASTGRPVLFRQRRIGFALEPFTMWKFRTMHVDSDDSVHRAYVAAMLASEEHSAPSLAGLHKLADDRITPIGHLLRKMSIDELPQLINVLRGDMSLVGPRPALPWEMELLDSQALVRFTVKPGITGLWQVSGRSRLTMNRALELDRQYVEQQSLVLDAYILIKTIPVVILGRGAA